MYPHNKGVTGKGFVLSYNYVSPSAGSTFIVLQTDYLKIPQGWGFTRCVEVQSGRK